MFKKVCSLGLVGMGLVYLSGCVVDGSESGANATVETQTQTFIDPDAKKETALGLIFGMPQVDDRLDYAGGDREDWRYIIVAEQGMMSITINVDQPKNLDGGWSIIDSAGRTLRRESFNKNVGYYEYKDFPVQRGVYYFQTFATSGKSIYTVATSFRPTAAPVVLPPTVEPEEEDEEIAEVKPTRPSKKPRKKAEPDPEPKPKPKADKPAEGKKIVGFISLITPKADGTAEVTVRDAGKNKGIEAGAIGRISGTSVKIEMTQCYPTSCRAIIPAEANPKGLKKGANVEFSM